MRGGRPELRLGNLDLPRDLARAEVRRPWFLRDLAVLEGLRAGDLVQVDCIYTSYNAYGGDPANPPKWTDVYRLDLDPRWALDYDGTWQLVTEVQPGPGHRRSARWAKLMVRAYNNSAVLSNRDKLGHLTSGCWVHLRPGPPISLTLAELVEQARRRGPPLAAGYEADPEVRGQWKGRKG
jgi:hypothetical protein